MCVGVGRGVLAAIQRTSSEDKPYLPLLQEGSHDTVQHKPIADGRRRPAPGKLVARQLHKIDVQTFFFSLSETVFPGPAERRRD